MCVTGCSEELAPARSDQLGELSIVWAVLVGVAESVGVDLRGEIRSRGQVRGDGAKTLADGLLPAGAMRDAGESAVKSEPELVAELGVSRAVFREAVRLLERDEIGRMRRGPGGG